MTNQFLDITPTKMKHIAPVFRLRCNIFTL